MKDGYNNMDITDIIVPIIVVEGTIPSAVSDIDLAECDSATLLFHIGLNASALSGSNYFTFALAHADDDGAGSSGDYTNVVTADVIGATVTSGIVLTIDADAEASQTYKRGYIGGKRFLKVTFAETGTLMSTPIAVDMVKGHLMDAPPL